MFDNANMTTTTQMAMISELRKVLSGIETMHMIKKGSCTALVGNPCPQQISSVAWLFKFQRQT